MKCQKCGSNLRKVDRRLETFEPDFSHEHYTDGQLSDYLQVQETSEHENWQVAVIEYQCRKCDSFVKIQKENLENFSSLILGWHEKANEDSDYFSRFVFEYLAFIAHVKNNLFYDASSDRQAIQRFKSDSTIRDSYLETIEQHEQLRESWEQLINELGRVPLQNTSHDLDEPQIDKWWNSDGEQPNHAQQSNGGIIQSLNDWTNMVEYWVSVRNNLFHAGKEPNIERDLFLVEQAYFTLCALMELEIKRLYPKD